MHYLTQDELETKLEVLGNDPLDSNLNAQELTDEVKRRGALSNKYLSNKQPGNMMFPGRLLLEYLLSCSEQLRCLFLYRAIIRDWFNKKLIV